MGENTKTPEEIQTEVEFINAQTNLLRFVNEYRTSLVDGYYTFDGKRWDCGEVAKTNIMGANVVAMLNGGNLPAGFLWRDADNNNWPVTGPYMVQLALSMSHFYNLAYQASWEHKAAINNLTTIEEILAYDYMSTLWPSPDA